MLAVFLLGLGAISAIYHFRWNYPPIRSDGLGYYLYLPAAFIHHDITLATTLNEQFAGQIPEGSGVHKWRRTGKYLIKYPLGEALLLSPFFFLAWLVALVIHAPVDGFSPPFQYATALAGLTYGVLGLAILGRLLSRRFCQKTALLVQLGILLGTPLFHFATYDAIFSHIYSFFLFCGFLDLTEKLYTRSASPLRYLAVGGVAGLILVTRPTNGLWLLFALLYGVTSLASAVERVRFWWRRPAGLLLILLPLLGVVALQLGYYRAIVGSFWVYSYRGETFHFNQPEIFNVLFSVRKGLFFWSPLLLTIFPGLLALKKKAPEFFLPAVIFFPLNVYLIASWHCWWYGGSFGHRAFVESLPLFALALAAWWTTQKATGRRWLTVYIVACSLLSTWLMVQYWTGVIPFDGTTWEQFCGAFWRRP